MSCSPRPAFRPLLLALVLVLPAFAASAATAQGTTHLLVISGLGGDVEHGERFYEWAVRLLDAASQVGIPDDQVRYLAEKTERDPERIDGRSTKEEVLAALEELAETSGPEDQVWIVLIGHGSATDDGGARLNLPGPDMTAAEFAAALQPVRGRIAFVNTASSSGGFVGPLAASDRAVVTATRSAGQRNETMFAEPFTAALAGGGADLDKNGNVSLLEAFEFARAAVQKHYEENNLLVTENPMLDDNGDGEGALAPPLLATGEGQEDGLLAGRLYFGDRQAAPADASPELVALIADRVRLERRVEELRLQKESLGEELYLAELETLLLELARTSAEIERLGGEGEAQDGDGGVVDTPGDPELDAPEEPAASGESDLNQDPVRGSPRLR